MKTYISLLFFAINTVTIYTQELDLFQVYDLAHKNSLFVDRDILLEKESEINKDIINKNYYPSLKLNSKLWYQSDVNSLPINIPGVHLPSIYNDQYNFQIDINQLIYNGGIIKLDKTRYDLEKDISQEKVKGDLNRLYLTITDTYFSILFLQKKNAILKALLESFIEQKKLIVHQIDQGTNYLGNLYLIDSEIVNVEKLIFENKHNIEYLYKILEIYTGISVNENTILKIPERPILPHDSLLNRYELNVLNYEGKLLINEDEHISRSRIPSIYIFSFAGYGRPFLNAFNNKFSFGYLLGVKIEWNIDAFYKYKDKKNNINIKKELIQNQKSIVSRNINVELEQKKIEISKVEAQLILNEKLVNYRSKALIISQEKLDNGISSLEDYLKSSYENISAKLTLELDLINLIKLSYEYINLQGNHPI